MIHDDHAILLQLITMFPLELELDDNDDVQAVVLHDVDYTEYLCFNRSMCLVVDGDDDEQ